MLFYDISFWELELLTQKGQFAPIKLTEGSLVAVVVVVV